ncbi:RES family NAD+ phosphorylase [uncultured Tateyamaria sp.]|uniref:RES family NAD+ phosphorylase n=1 Tax=uncultured Tateyamaria sp. TaxID=455651 RepID=UPI00262F668F|nr:RES family NAD+ phosphorylase [uncultured Tateyamaria sp.]
MSPRRSSHDVALLDALSELPEVPFEGNFWRVVNGVRSPLDGSKGAGRWNVRENEVLYCALEKDGALSEIYFHINRQQSVFPSRLTSTVHKLKATFGRTLDLSDIDLLSRIGVDPGRYTEILYDQTQKIGEAVNFLGFEAVLVPNARHNSINLVVFPQNCDLDEISQVEANQIDWTAWRSSQKNT